MKKIIVIGAPGSGKSTLARILHSITSLPVIHLDSLSWEPGWRKTSKEARIVVQQEIVQNEEWIIDGTYQSTVDIRLEAADTVIFLDMNRILCLWRVIKRHILYRRKLRPDLAEGCNERINWNYLNEVWNFPTDEKKKLIKKLNYLSDEQKIIWLTSKSEVLAFTTRLHNLYDRV